MQRVAQVIGIKPDRIDDYERVHSAVWEAVLERLSLSNITNYSIYRMDTLLFSYFEYVGEDYDADMAAVAADPATREWWRLCEPMQQPLDDRPDGAWWRPLPEVFHQD